MDEVEEGAVSVSVSVGLEVLSAVALTQLSEGLLLNLADALSREVEAFANLFQGERVLTPDAEVEARDLGLAVVQGTEGTLNVDLDRFGEHLLVR